MDGREERMKKVRWENRKTNVLKKGRELATLCGIRLCVVTVSPDGKVETWPENAAAVKAVLHDAVKAAAEKQSVCPRKQQQPEIPDGMMISTDDYEVPEVEMELRADLNPNYYLMPEYNGESHHHHQFQHPSFCSANNYYHDSAWQTQNQWTQSNGFSFGAGDNDFQGGGMMPPPPPQGSAGGVFDPLLSAQPLQQYEASGYGNFPLGDYYY
ncbi:unnamed protein product [Cuscuta epithymum]|uniref:MADS-box domain-containing protein n=1 Tax=Cuscuta epithymum TaxID=186058 RepID=A0AAV0EGT8_9ASTE|nr:unnamed protein product [Cuscuta epithymum]